MKFLFENESFSFETLRTAGFTLCGGADLGEVITTAGRIGEAVITPVVDYALTRGEIAADRIALFGYSLGGQLVARAAAFEHLVAAPTTLVTLTEEEGAGEHTHAGGLGRAHQVMFDWLDTTLGTPSENGAAKVAGSGAFRSAR